MSFQPQAHTPDHASTPTGSRKVAIPRLQRAGQVHNTSKDRRRVSRACTNCRLHKIKCSGETPKCKHCENTGRECVYVMPRKDRLKIVTDRCIQMASLLGLLKKRANDEESARIAEMLELVEEDISDIRQTAVPSNPDTDGDEFREGGDTSTSDGLTQVELDSLDLLDEDLQKDERARATGFVGKNSEVQWLRTVAMLQLERTDDESARAMLERRGSYAEQVSAFTFWLDAEKIDLDFYVDAYEMPTPEMAERLLGVYMARVHDSFPILPQRLFEDQFRKFFRALQNDKAPRLNARWQAILNLVFAIGAKYSHLVGASWRADNHDHIIYQNRARAFGVNEEAIMGHPDVPQIQVLGLLAFYWLSIGQVSRAWVAVGTALRSAYALGLHIRNEDPSASAGKRETLVRIWWSLYSLERQLSIITGRPSIIVDSSCSVPLPLPIPEDQISDDTEAVYRMRKSSITSSTAASPTFSLSSNITSDYPRTLIGLGTTEANSGSYFKAVIQLGIVVQNILTSLYSAGTMIRTPSDIQQDISQLNLRLDQWGMSLPTEFNFQHRPTGSSSSLSAFARERMLLGLQFFGAKIVLTRPCMSGLSQAGRDGGDGSFAHRMAIMCLEAAGAAVDLLPDQPSPQFAYEQGPWWSIVHHLMQAISIFLLGLSYSSPDGPALVLYAKKVIRWLRAMQDPLAERAYCVALNSFLGVASRLGVNISDLLIENTTAFPNQDVPHAAAGPQSGAGGPAHHTAAQFTPGAIPLPMVAFAPFDTSTYPPQVGKSSFDGSSFQR